MADAYQFSNPGPGQLPEINEWWAPYRSWVAFLLRAQVRRAEPPGPLGA